MIGRLFASNHPVEIVIPGKKTTTNAKKLAHNIKGSNTTFRLFFICLNALIPITPPPD